MHRRPIEHFILFFHVYIRRRCQHQMQAFARGGRDFAFFIILFLFSLLQPLIYCGTCEFAALALVLVAATLGCRPRCTRIEFAIYYVYS